MTRYTVQKLANLAGVTVRTLHYYDSIDLLKPLHRSDKRYRYYGRNEVLQLQQILFYRELDFPLKEIDKILNDPDFNLLNGLKYHQEKITNKIKRLKTLKNTINKTIHSLKNKYAMMTDQEIYEGLQPEKVTSMRREVSERWGKNELIGAEERIRNMGKEKWNDVKQRGEDIADLLAGLMNSQVNSLIVQKAVQLHFEYMNHFYEVSKERYLGLSKIYMEDERFKSYYDDRRDGLANFVRKAIIVFCDNDLQVKGND